MQEYYTYGGVGDYMEGQGIKEGKSDGLHDDPIITLNMFITDPKSVRYDERVKAGKATINGFDISDRKKATELAKKIVDFRAQHTVDAIKKAIANKGTLPAPRTRTRQSGTGRTAGPAAQPWHPVQSAISERRAHDALLTVASRFGVADALSAQAPAVSRRAQDPRSMGGGNCANNPIQLRRHAQSSPAANTVWIEEMTWMDVRDALKAGKTTAIISDRRHGAQRPVAGDRQAQLRAAHQLRRHRAQAGQRAVRADRQARARRAHRAAERPHDAARARSACARRRSRRCSPTSPRA